MPSFGSNFGGGKHTLRATLPAYVAYGQSTGSFTFYKPNTATKGTQYPTLYSLTQDSSETFRGYGSVSASSGFGLSYSADSAYFVVASQEWPYISFWNQTSTNTWVKMTFDAPLHTEFAPGSPGFVDICMSPNGNYCVAVGNNTPYIAFWIRSGSNWARQTASSSFSSLPSAAPTSCSWNGNSTQFAFTSATTSPYIFTYSFDNTTNYFTLNSAPATGPGSAAYSCKYNVTSGTASTVLVVGHNLTPFVTVYGISSSTYTKMTNPTTLPTSAILYLGVNPAGTQFLVAANSSPYLYLYTVSGTTVTNAAITAPVATTYKSIDYTTAGDRVALVTSSSGSTAFYIMNISSSTYTNQTLTYTGPGPGNSGSTHTGVRWSDSNIYITLTTQAFPYIRRLKTTTPGGNTLTATGISPLPGLISYTGMYSSTIYTVRFSSTGTYLAVGTGNLTPNAVYSNSGGTLTKLAATGTSQSSNCWDVDWGASDTLITFGQGVSPYIKNYSFNSSTNAFTAISAPASLPTSSPYSVRYNPAGTILSLGLTSSPYILSYSISGTTYTALSSPATTPTGTCYGLSWNSAGTVLACGHASSPYITVYSVSGSTFTKMSNPATLPTATVSSVALSPDGTILVATTTAGYLWTFTISGTTITYVGPAGGVSTGYTYGGSLKWSNDGKVLMMMGSSYSGFTRDQFSYLSLWTYRAGVGMINIPSTMDYEGFIPYTSPYYNKMDFYDDGTMTAVGYN